MNGLKVELHHIKGYKNCPDLIAQIQKSNHILFHRMYGYRNFIDIRLIEDFVKLIV